MKKIVCLFLSFLATLSTTHSDEIETLKLESQEEFCKFLPFKLALPGNFVGVQIYDWLTLGEESTLGDFVYQSQRNPQNAVSDTIGLNPKSGYIRIKLSQNSDQEEIFGEDSDGKILEALKSHDAKIRNLYFGSYPVKAVESGIDEGKPFFMGWIGLNCGGPILLFNYIVPKNQPSYKKEIEIWNRFLSETVERSEEEMEAIYRAHPEC